MNIAQALRLICQNCAKPARFEVVLARGRRLGVFCTGCAADETNTWNRREAEMHEAQTTLDEQIGVCT